LPANRLQNIAVESDELCRIISASIKTSRSNN
jgi:hypothetical protein